MSETKDHGYGWDDLRERPARELAVGDVFISPVAFAAYTTGRDGRVAGVIGCGGPRGTAWTVVARDGDVTTCRSHDGREQTQEIPERARVLKVVGPEPVGTVLAVNSHRARERLERALGRKPAGYYDRAMRRGGEFVVLYGDDVARALEITSITRTRLKPDDVVLCLGEEQRARRDADRAAGESRASA